jgi:hypothetical protein
MKSSRLSWLAILLVTAGCTSDDHCTALLPAVVDSVVIGASRPYYDPEDVVTWRDGEDVELIYGLQGSLMLVAEVLARGSGLTEDLTYPDTTIPGHLPYDLTISMEGVGVVVQKSDYNPASHAADGSWYHERLQLPFEFEVPEEGEALDVRLTLGCIEIQRTLIAHLPEE